MRVLRVAWAGRAAVQGCGRVVGGAGPDGSRGGVEAGAGGRRDSPGGKPSDRDRGKQRLVWRRRSIRSITFSIVYSWEGVFVRRLCLLCPNYPYTPSSAAVVDGGKGRVRWSGMRQGWAGRGGIWGGTRRGRSCIVVAASSKHQGAITGPTATLISGSVMFGRRAPARRGKLRHVARLCRDGDTDHLRDGTPPPLRRLA